MIKILFKSLKIPLKYLPLKYLPLKYLPPIPTLLSLVTLLFQPSHSSSQEFSPIQDIEENPQNTENLQNQNPDNQIITEYYKIFKENFYKEDEFLEQISNPRDESYFFIVKKDPNQKILNAAYYVQKKSNSGQTRFSIAQYVSQDGFPYHYITYQYNDQLQLIKKEFKNKNDKLIHYYQYLWNKNTLKSLKKYGKTPYLGQMELKSFYTYQWNDPDQLKTFSYYDPSGSLIEKYHFLSNPNSGEDKSSQFLVGNHQISMLVLDKYERYYLMSNRKKIRSYYIQYQINNQKIFQEKYNHDNVLIEELFPLNIPGNDNLDNNFDEIDNPVQNP